jgi:hypothetical protein
MTQCETLRSGEWLLSRRDDVIVAWHEVPGTAPPQKTRPVGYGVIPTGVRTDPMIGVTKQGAHFRREIFWD